MLARTILTTRRLRLRQWRRADIKLYARHCNTPEVMEWLGGVMTPRQVLLDYEYFQRQQRRNGFTFWVLERKSDKAFLGFCGLVRITERSSGLFGELEIGWRVRADKWRRGYAHEAAISVFELAFSTLEVPMLVSRVAVCNERSEALMQKLGMRHRPSLDYVHPADRTHLRVYSIAANEWRAPNTARR